MGEQIDGVPVSSGTVRAAMSDDGSGLVLTRHLARVLGESRLRPSASMS